MSEGMVLDAPLLNWKSGSHGLAAILPSDERKPLFFKAGDKVPRSRPRSDGLVGDEKENESKKEEVVETMFARKLTKEEKKAALEAKRAARAERKKGGGGGGGDA